MKSIAKRWVDMRAWMLASMVASVLTLSGCAKPEEKATRFFEKGNALLAEGELVKARIEYQNALQIKGDMVGPLYGLALVAERQADWQRVFALLNRVVELDPQHLEAQLKLGRLYLVAGQLDKALSKSDITLALSKDSAAVLSLRSAVLYKLDDKAGAIVQANAALARDVNNVDALVVLATERLDAKDARSALVFLDRGLQSDEKNVALQLIKVQALEALSQLDSAEAVFRRLIALYPQTRQFRYILAQFYLSHGRAAEAEAEYRAVAAENPKDGAAQLELVRFVSSLKGVKAAGEELTALIGREPRNFELRFALAGLQQQQGEAEAARLTLRGIAADAGDEPAGLRAKGQLAAGLLAQGQKEPGRALVAEVLAEDQRNEQALLLRATLAMGERKLDDAIADPRTILRDVPDSARALLLLGQAHEMAGSVELAQEHFLKAFQAGRQAPAFGLPYGEFLLRRGQAARAEAVAEDMQRQSAGNEAGNVAVLRLLAQARINQGNWAGAQAVADELAKLDRDGRMANQVRGAVFAARRNYAESIAAYKRAFDAAPAESQPMVALVRSYLVAGKPAEAIRFLESVLGAAPGNTNARLLLGQLQANQGELAPAVKTFELVVKEQPAQAAGYIGLANTQIRARKMDDAQQTVSRGLAATPDNFGLRVMQAGLHELNDRPEEAIKVYEQLLKDSPNADVVANNLASLLADKRTDKASLERAHELAKRFVRSPVPQFKDTLGWTHHRLGQHSQATPLIADAVKQLPELPVLHYHLGMTYLAQNRPQEARQSLEKALALGASGGFAEADQARSALKGL